VILRWPLAPEHRRITQHFGANPADYAAYGLAGHEGIDLGCSVGTPVYAAHAGTAQILSAPDTYGLYLQLWGNDVMTLYAHLSGSRVAQGETVRAGDIIALSGNTGRSTGPHLHFGVCPLPRDMGNNYKGWVDPEPYLHEGERIMADALEAAKAARYEQEEVVRLMEDARALRAQAADCLALAERKEGQAFMRLQQAVNTRNGVAYVPEVLLGGDAPAGWEG